MASEAYAACEDEDDEPQAEADAVQAELVRDIDDVVDFIEAVDFDDAVDADDVDEAVRCTGGVGRLTLWSYAASGASNGMTGREGEAVADVVFVTVGRAVSGVAGRLSSASA